MIKLSKKWGYALKTVIYLAWKDILLKVNEVSVAQNISESLLRRIIADLEKTWILITIKWRNGWVKIWKDLSKISVYDILYSVWEELSIRDCSKWIICYNNDNCLTVNLIKNLQKWFNGILKINTIDKLVKKK
jgi:Rrf2 family protein